MHYDATNRNVHALENPLCDFLLKTYKRFKHKYESKVDTNDKLSLNGT